MPIREVERVSPPVPCRGQIQPRPTPAQIDREPRIVNTAFVLIDHRFQLLVGEIVEILLLADFESKFQFDTQSQEHNHGLFHDDNILKIGQVLRVDTVPR